MLDVRIEKSNNVEHGNLDGFLVINTESFNRATTWYLSGFTGSTAMLLLCPSEQFILTDSRYFIQSREESPFTLKKVAGRDYMGLLEKMLKRRGIKRLGVESDKLTLEQYKQLKSFGVEVVGTTDIFLEMRSIKEDGVMADIRKVCNITATALQNTFAKLKSGSQRPRSRLNWFMKCAHWEHSRLSGDTLWWRQEKEVQGPMVYLRIKKLKTAIWLP